MKKSTSKINAHAEILIQVNSDNDKVFSIVPKKSNIDIFEKIISDYVGQKRIPQLRKELKAEEAKAQKTIAIIKWQNGTVYNLVNVNGHPELLPYTGVTYAEVEAQIRRVVDGQMMDSDIKDFIKHYMAEVAERTVFTDQIEAFRLKMENTFEEISTTNTYSVETVKTFFDEVKSDFDLITVSDESRTQIIEFLEKFEEKLKKYIQPDVYPSEIFLKNLISSLKIVDFAESEKETVTNILNCIKRIAIINPEFSENSFYIEGSDSPIYTELSSKLNSLISDTRFEEMGDTLKRNIKQFYAHFEKLENISGFYATDSYAYFSTSDQREIHITPNLYKASSGISPIVWDNALESVGFKLGSEDQFILFLAKKILNNIASSSCSGLSDFYITKNAVATVFGSYSGSATHDISFYILKDRYHNIDTYSVVNFKSNYCLFSTDSICFDRDKNKNTAFVVHA